MIRMERLTGRNRVGGGEGRKNTPTRNNCSFGERRTLDRRVL